MIVTPEKMTPVRNGASAYSKRVSFISNYFPTSATFGREKEGSYVAEQLAG